MCVTIVPIFRIVNHIFSSSQQLNYIFFNFQFSAASYRGPGEDEDPDHYSARIAFSGNTRILGPGCIVVGFIMLTAGFFLCFLTRRARRREQTIGFHCPLHGDFYPLSPVTNSKTIGGYKIYIVFIIMLLI